MDNMRELDWPWRTGTENKVRTPLAHPILPGPLVCDVNTKEEREKGRE